MKTIIYAPLWNEDSGGSVVLHQLCKLLCDCGVDAKIWYWTKPRMSREGFIGFLCKYIRYLFQRLKKYKEYRSPYNLRYASEGDLRDCMVVYPEVTAGNPLCATRVVRWLLNKPGVLAEKVGYGNNELYFYYDKVFDEELIPGQQNQLLRVVMANPAYNKNNYSRREGCCYIVRKGENRSHDYHEDGCVRLDGLKHDEIAVIFNRCRYFYTYDLYTFYTSYAALCGCIPIVVPEDGISEEEWQPDINIRYGIAYGRERVQWAEETREKLFENVRRMEDESLSSVRNFITASEKFFSKNNVSM